MKHYGFRGVSGTKQAISTKLYEAIGEKFQSVWGNYAGWAHSVGFPFCSRVNALTPRPQVSFTADLKAFSDYGVPSPEPSPKKHGSSISRTASKSAWDPVPTARKRKPVLSQDSQNVEGLRMNDDSPREASSITDRVKKRRRVLQAPSSA